MKKEIEKTAQGRTKTKNPFVYFFDRNAGEGYVPNRELMQFGTGLAGQNMTYALVSGWMFYFCTNILKIQPIHVGTITAVSRIWDGINDPIVGTLVDRIPPKNGYKLHRYLGKLALVIGFLSILLFINPGFGETGLIAWILAVYILWDMAYSFQDVALWGTLSLLSPHSEERTRASQWVTIGASIGAGIVGVVPVLMDISGRIGISEKQLFFVLALVFGFGGEALSMMSLKTKERIVHTVDKDKPSFFKQLLEIRHNKILIALILAQTLNGLSITVPWIYFFKYCVSYEIGGKVIGGESVQFIYSVLAFIPGNLCMLIATRLMKKMGGPKRSLMIAQFTAIGVRLICFFIGYDTIPKIAAVTLLMALSSIPTSIMGIINRSFLCDSVDYMEWKTGTRTEGLVSSMQNFVAKIGSALQSLINGIVLEALHFDNSLEGIEGQPPEFYKWQWPLFILGPAIGAALYLVPMLFLKYTEAERAQVEKDLSAKRLVENSEKAETGV